jgi:hypothetical protein
MENLNWKATTNSPKDCLSYKLNFVEPNRRGGKDPWSRRHLGVYHHHTSESDLYILLHCTSSSALYQQLAPSAKNSGAVERLLTDVFEHPGSLHDAILACYIHHWRFYLRDMGDEVSSMVSSPKLHTILARPSKLSTGVNEPRNQTRTMRPWSPRSPILFPRTTPWFVGFERSGTASASLPLAAWAISRPSAQSARAGRIQQATCILVCSRRRKRLSTVTYKTPSPYKMVLTILLSS